MHSDLAPVCYLLHFLSESVMGHIVNRHALVLAGCMTTNTGIRLLSSNLVLDLNRGEVLMNFE